MGNKRKTPEQIREAIAESSNRDAESAKAEIVLQRQGAISPFSDGLNAMILRAVRERVDEIVTERDARNMRPEFLPRKISEERKRSKNMFELKKWSLYFEKWGCRMCHRKNVNHMANGCCGRCQVLVTQRLKQIKANFDRDNPEAEIFRQIDRLTLPVRTAQALLGKGGQDDEG